MYYLDSEELVFFYGIIIIDGKDMFNSDLKEVIVNVCVFVDSEVRIFFILFVFIDFFWCK